jgi:hypothetical protein
MTITQGALLGAFASIFVVGAFMFGRMQTTRPTQTSLPAVSASMSAPPPSALPSSVAMPTPIIMRPPAATPAYTSAARAAVSTAASSVQPTGTSIVSIQGKDEPSTTYLARAKAQFADMARQRDQANRQNAVDGKPPMPDYMPTFHYSSDGSVYHYQDGAWHKMTDQELLHPTDQENAESTAGMDRARADNHQ